MLLAIEDFVPVVFSGFGLWLIAEAVGRAHFRLGSWARLGALLAFLGGLSKATHKLVLAATGSDIRILDDALFPLLATGFALTTSAVWLMRREARQTQVVRWVVPGVVAIGGGAWAAGLADRAFLGIATLASVLLSALLITWSTQRGLRLGAWLFGLSLLLTLVLGGMAPTLGDAPEYQWLEQGTNTVTQALFLAGAWMLVRHRTSDRISEVRAT